MTSYGPLPHGQSGLRYPPGYGVLTQSAVVSQTTCFAPLRSGLRAYLQEDM